MKNITRIRVMCGIKKLDCDELSETFKFDECDYSEEGMEEMMQAMETAQDNLVADECWLEYYVPLEGEWSRFEDLPAICLPKHAL